MFKMLICFQVIICVPDDHSHVLKAIVLLLIKIASAISSYAMIQWGLVHVTRYLSNILYFSQLRGKLKNTGNYLQNHLLCTPWLVEKQPITGRYQHICHTTTCVHILQTNRPLFSFDTNDVTRNFDCWRSRLIVSNSMWRTTYEDGHPIRDSTHLETKNSPSILWICMDQPPKLHETERTVTRTNAIVKSAENTSFCNYSSLLYLFHLI